MKRRTFKVSLDINIEYAETSEAILKKADAMFTEILTNHLETTLNATNVIVINTNEEPVYEM